MLESLFERWACETVTYLDLTDGKLIFLSEKKRRPGEHSRVRLRLGNRADNRFLELQITVSASHFAPPGLGFICRANLVSFCNPMVCNGVLYCDHLQRDLVRGSQFCLDNLGPLLDWLEGQPVFEAAAQKKGRTPRARTA